MFYKFGTSWTTCTDSFCLQVSCFHTCFFFCLTVRGIILCVIRKTFSFSIESGKCDFLNQMSITNMLRHAHPGSLRFMSAEIYDG